MAQQILPTNTFTTAKWIVSATASDGTHTTIATALTSASSGDTIFIRPGTYTENLTLKAGVNLTAFGSDSSLNGTANVIISGTCTLTSAGSVTISGIQLQTNSAALLAITGSAASIVNLNNCYLNCTNNTGITFSSSSGSATLLINNCEGDLGTTGIGLFSHSSSGSMSIRYSHFTNSGSSLTASTCSSGTLSLTYSLLTSAVTTSSTGSIQSVYSTIDVSSFNIIAATFGGSGVHVLRYCRYASGTASAVSIGSATPVLEFCTISSSNTNAVTGSGTLTGNSISFEGTSSGVNTTTQTMLPVGITNTWTPNLQINASSTGITYSNQTGGYTILGNVVSIWGRIVLSNKGASSGNITISNLPIVASTNGGAEMLGIFYFNQYTDVGYTTLGLQLTASSAVATLVASGTGVGVHAPTNTTISNTFEIRFSGIYLID